MGLADMWWLVGVGGGRKKSWWTSMQCLICWLFFKTHSFEVFWLVLVHQYVHYLMLYNMLNDSHNCLYIGQQHAERQGEIIVYKNHQYIGCFKFHYHYYWQISNGIWFLNNTSKWIIYFSSLYIKFNIQNSVCIHISH